MYFVGETEQCQKNTCWRICALRQKVGETNPKKAIFCQLKVKGSQFYLKILLKNETFLPNHFRKKVDVNFDGGQGEGIKGLFQEKAGKRL